MYRTHGGSYTVEYQTWEDMRRRCFSPTHRDYKDYGGRGITVCARWNSFANFRQDMGARPPAHSLDRRDNNGPYSPDNCHWATIDIQNNNSRANHFIEFDGKILTMAQWSRVLGIKKYTIYNRLSVLKWPIERALTEAVRLRKAWNA